MYMGQYCATVYQRNHLPFMNHILSLWSMRKLHGRSQLAALYDEQGLYEDAIQLQLRALDIHEKVYGSDHPYTAITLNNLGNTYRMYGFYSKVELLLSEPLI